MGIVYSLYDALVSINVPTEKAKAVIDALEREMMDKIATKADLEHARQITAKDIEAVSLSVGHARDVLAQSFKAEISGLGNELITRLYITAVGATALICTILGTLVVLA
jgi:hypothetical protein